VARATRTRPLANGAVARVVHTSRADGDLAVTNVAAVLDSRRAAVVDRPWLWMHQVHGNGVVVATVGAMRDLGASEIEATIGPCIHVECYEFGSADLAALAEQFGPDVRGHTSSGAPALDVPALAHTVLCDAGVDEVEVVHVCTACDERFWSHRGGGDTERQATVVWMSDE